MKVDILMASGRKSAVHPKIAQLLTSSGRASYITRDMVASPVVAPPVIEVNPVATESEPTIEQLREEAESLGLKVHHRAGIATLRAAIAAAKE